MVKGVKSIITHWTPSDEYGVYRVTSEKHRYLLFVCSYRSEAIERGKAIANLLGVPFQNWIPGISMDQQKREDEELGKEPNSRVLLLNTEEEPVQQSRPGKKKKVMGVSKRCTECLSAGMSDDEIVEDILPKYLDVGRERTEAIDSIRSLLKYAKEEYSKTL